MKTYKKPKVLSASGAPALTPALAAAALSSVKTAFVVGVAAGLALKGDKISNIKIVPLKKVEQMV